MAVCPKVWVKLSPRIKTDHYQLARVAKKKKIFSSVEPRVPDTRLKAHYQHWCIARRVHTSREFRVVTDSCEKQFAKIWYPFQRLRLSVRKKLSSVPMITQTIHSGSKLTSVPTARSIRWKTLSSVPTARAFQFKKIVIRSKSSGYPLEKICHPFERLEFSV